MYFVQEAVVQYEQYEHEVKDLQSLIEEAHRVIQDRPIPTNNIQELQAQILHHEVKYTHLTHFLSCGINSFLDLQLHHNQLFIYEGAGTENKGLSGTDCITEFKMQDAGSEGQACRDAADCE